MPDNAKPAPHRTILTGAGPAVATAGNDAATALAVVPYAGTIAAVDYTPAAAITGAATHNRRLRLINKGQDGNGTTVVAEIQFGNGVNVDDYTVAALTLSGTAANLAVAAGDVLGWQSTHIGDGITDPGGLVRIAVERA